MITTKKDLIHKSQTSQAAATDLNQLLIFYSFTIVSHTQYEYVAKNYRKSSAQRGTQEYFFNSGGKSQKSSFIM